MIGHKLGIGRFQIGAVLNSVEYFSEYFPTVADRLLTDLSGNNHPLSLTRKNCLISTNTFRATLSDNIIYGNHWAIEFDLDDVDITHNWNVLIGSTTTEESIRLNGGVYGNGIYIRFADNSYVLGTVDTSVITWGKVTFVHTRTEIIVYWNGVEFDRITTSKTLTCNLLFNYINVSWTFGLIGACSDIKARDLSSYTGDYSYSSIVAEALSAWLTLCEYDSDYTYDGDLIYNDVMESGLTCTVLAALSSRLGKCNGAAYDFLYGFAKMDGDNKIYPKNQSGVGYAGLVDSPDYEYLPKSTHSMQYVIAPTTDTELINKIGATQIALSDI
jgi:hypothetical protein